ncbi:MULTISPECIES: hypothetical protein [Methylobacterium]|nr:hypothetical protein [Methylobacterium sp. DB0501]
MKQVTIALLAAATLASTTLASTTLVGTAWGDGADRSRVPLARP